MDGRAVCAGEGEVWGGGAAEALGDPGAEEERGHVVLGGVGDFDLGDGREVFEGAGVLEAGGEGGAKEVGAGPTEVTDIEVGGFTFQGGGEGGKLDGGVCQRELSTMRVSMWE